MSVTSGFFNSLNHDRKYDATQMSSLFDGIINDGVFMSIGTHLNVTPGGGMIVNVGVGKAWFNHTWTLNDAELPLSLDAAELVLDRIDAVVLEVNASESVRDNSIKIVKGEPSSEPARPIMEESETVHQYALAYIYVKANATTITESEITNMIGTGDTPFITGILETINIDSLIAQWKSQWNDQISANQKEYDAWLLAQQTSFLTWRDGETDAFTRWKTTEQAEFEEWFANLQNQLDENQATNLQNQIDEIRDELEVTGGSRVIVTIDDKKGTVNVTGLTATLRIGGSEYTATVGDDNKAIFTGVLEIGIAEIECNDSKQGLSTSCTLEIPYYGSYEATTVKIDMYEQWLATAGYTLNDYPEVSNILSDEEAMFRMMNLHASVDYWIRWYTADNTILPKFTASATAMKAIGDNDYAADTLMAIPEVKVALLASEYWEYILNAKVPVMTSNTAPYGEASGSSSTSVAWKAFNGTVTDREDMWCVTGTSSGWIQYRFTNPIRVNKISITNRDASDNTCAIKNFIVQGSNDNSTWTDLGSFVKSDGAKNTEQFNIDNNNSYLYYRISISSIYGYDMAIAELQFYGRKLNALVPTMTSNTAPEGEASTDSTPLQNANTQAFRAFDGDNSTFWCTTNNDGTDYYLQYKFTTAKLVNTIKILPYYVGSNSRLKDFIFQASNDGNTFVELYSGTCANSKSEQYFDIPNETKYLYYRLFVKNNYSASTDITGVYTLQFYGPSYEETVKPVVGGKFDYAAWCEAAGMNAGNYASLDDLLDNEKGVRTLMTKTASVDYLVQALSGDSASANTILNDIYVAKWVNYREYSYSSLSAVPSLKSIMDKTGKYGMYITAIKSDAKPVDEEVDKALVPTMTSNTCSVGEVSANSYYNDCDPYHAFDDYKYGWSNKTNGIAWLMYKFENPTIISRVYYKNLSESNNSFILQGSNNGEDFVDIDTVTANANSSAWLNLSSANMYMYYRLYSSNTNIAGNGHKFQFYGYQLIPMVPTMKSNVCEDGEIIASSQLSDTYRSWYAFDGDDSTYWIPNSDVKPDTLTYKFTSKRLIKFMSLSFLHNSGDTDNPKYKLQASNDGIEFVDLTDYIEVTKENKKHFIKVANDNHYLYYRLTFDPALAKNGSPGNYSGLIKLQFYGVEKWQPKGLVPVMTSNTAPYGEASASSIYGTGYSAWMAYDNSDDDYWHAAKSVTSGYCGYKFANPTSVKMFSLKNRTDNAGAPKNIQLQGSNDNTEWNNIGDALVNSETMGAVTTFVIDNSDYYLYYRINIIDSYSDALNICAIQFYGRQLEALVPPMTSNTAPSGEASGSEYSSGYELYRAFNGLTGAGNIWLPAEGVGQYCQYDFGYDVCANTLLLNLSDDGGSNNTGVLPCKFELEVSKNGVDYVTLKSDISCTSENVDYVFDLDNNESYRYYRLKTATSLFNDKYAWTGVQTLQLYGAPDYDSRTYIYDHGVEVMEIDKDGSFSGFAMIKPTLNSDNITLASSGSSTMSMISTTEQIDLTNHSLLSVNIIDGTAVSDITAALYVMTVKNDASASTHQLAVDITGYLHSYLDVSNVNQSAYIIVESMEGRTAIVNELWLK